MATVVSLTEQKIKELLSGYEGVALSQDEINVLVQQLAVEQDSVAAQMDTIQNTNLPQLQSNLDASAITLANLNDNTIPNLQADLEQVDLEVINMKTVDIPALQTGLANEIENTITRPKVYVQPEAPTNPNWEDEQDRDLVVGDTWFDSDNDNKQTIWNGVEWSTFGVEISDFSLTVRKFLTTSHMIY